MSGAGVGKGRGATALTSPEPEAVAGFLREHPDFLDERPELLASLSLHHATGGKAVSLIERQVDVLRQRQRELEGQCQQMLGFAEENAAIAARFDAFVRDLLLVREPAHLPASVVGGLQRQFSVPQVALRLWRVGPAFRGMPWGQPPEAAIIEMADALDAPSCGADGSHPVAAWLSPEGAHTHSLALIPLRGDAQPTPFGLLALGAADPDRFGADMGTAFLERLMVIVGAALARLTDDA